METACAEERVQVTGRGSRGAASLRMLLFLILAAVLAAFIMVQQRGSGAYVAEFSATDAQEVRHFVSGLMLADYVRSGAPSLSAFAQDYGLRFPALDPWAAPPLFYVVEGAWLSALMPTTPAVLLLPAFMSALLVVGAAWTAGRAMGVLPGVAVGAVLIALPALREATIVIGLQLPLALLAFAAALAFASYLQHGRRRDAVAFTVAATAAVLTDRAGLALVAVPPLALALGGRLGLGRRPSFWVSLGLVTLVAGGWLHLSGGPGTALPDLAEAERRAGDIRGSIGGALLILAGMGALFAAVRSWRQDAGAAPMIALAAMGLAFFLLSPAAPDASGLLPLLAPVAVLAAYGATGLLGLVTSGWPTLSGLLVAFVLLFAALPAMLETVHKPALGLDEAAQTLLARDMVQPVVLVEAEAKGEGALIAAMAQHDRRQRSFVLRASGAALAGAASSPAMLMTRLDDLGASFLVIGPLAAQGTPSVLATVVEAYPDRFLLLGTYGSVGVRLYAVSGNGAQKIEPAEMKSRLEAAGS